jgi:branched-chain amino acid transport system substrate-binding protein
MDASSLEERMCFILKQINGIIKIKTGKKMSKNIVIVIGIIVLSMGQIGCQSKEPIKIGLVGTMTGPNSDLSVSGRRGAEMAIDEINSKGGVNGHKLELVVKDDLNDATVALKMDQEFVKENVRLIIGHYTSGMVSPNMDFINSQEVLMMGPTISADNLSALDDNFIRFIASTKEQASALIEAAQKLKQSNFIILYDERNKAFTEPLVLNFDNQLKNKLGASAKILSFNPNQPELLTQALDAVKAEKPQAIFLIASAEDSASIASKIKEINSGIQLYGPLWANTPELIKKGGLAVEGMMIVGALDNSNQTETFINFKKDFSDRYGEAPTFSSMYSYETMKALAKSIDESNSIKPIDVKAKLIEIGTFDGVQEPFTIDQFGDNSRKYLIFKIENGSLVLY